MKKTFFIVLLLAVTTAASAQFYIGLGSSYSMGYNGSGIMNAGALNTAAFNADSASSEAIMASFGGGLFSGLSLGYRVNDILSLEISGGVHKTNSLQTQIQLGANSMSIKYKYGGTLTSIRPSAVFIFRKTNTMQAYSRLGLAYTFGNINIDIAVDYPAANYSSRQHIEYQNCTGFGVLAGIGAQVFLNKQLRLNAEIQTVNLALRPKSAEMLSYTENGKDILNTLTLNNRKTLFEKNVDQFIIGNTANEPFKTGTQKIQLNGLGLSIGLIYEFSKKKTAI